MISTDLINAPRDPLVPTTGCHGADIASKRLDDLDRRCLEYALTLPPGSVVLDLGAGLGFQGVRLALLGLEAVLIDFIPPSALVRGVQEVLGGQGLTYLKMDLRCLEPTDIPPNVSLCYSQRFLHYLTHEEARRLLELLVSRMASPSRLFLSASGLATELGDEYEAADLPIETRYARLSDPMAKKHDIRAPLCLYRLTELRDLGTAVGLTPLSVQPSAFGNIKAVFELSDS